MRCASIGSGSKGNALLVEHNHTTILLDCGFSLKHFKSSLTRLGKSLEDIDAVFITHEHSDHISGLKTFARNTEAAIYMSFGTAVASKSLSLPRINYIGDGQNITVGDLQILPVTVPHDAREPYQFVIETRCQQSAPRSLGVLTDLGSVPPYVAKAYGRCDALVVEANYDLAMLQAGPYPPSVKRRVGSDWGHLSNEQAAQFVSTIDQDKLQWLVAAHVSENNNCVKKVAEVFSQSLNDEKKLNVATQEQGFSWMQIQ